MDGQVDSVFSEPGHRVDAFAALGDPTSRAYYDRKRAEHKTHNQAVLALARRRCDVLFAMLRDGTHYDPEHAQAA